jgi:hypothetical protein
VPSQWMYWRTPPALTTVSTVLDRAVIKLACALAAPGDTGLRHSMSDTAPTNSRLMHQVSLTNGVQPEMHALNGSHWNGP